MSIKCILAPMSGIESDKVVGQAAVVIAKRFKSQIQVIFSRGSMALVAGGLMGDERDEAAERFFEVLRENDEAAEAEVRETFEELLKSLGAGEAEQPTALLDITEDAPVQAVIERGGAYDLLIVALPGEGATDQAKAREIAEAALFNTGRQVLLVPEGAELKLGNKVMVCWNRSQQAGRAVAQAMPFLEGAAEVCIFYVDTGAKRGPSPGRLKHYLGLHGVKAGVVEAPPDYREVGEQILDQAHSSGADLLVMGAYSQSRLRERLLGGVTSYIFAHSDIPVLMTR
ncbi:MAG TPA: universal stress protein [Alphaproteobacteria bacterium]|nr:universal stress protein [Alphaproteobacteria bacterium]